MGDEIRTPLLVGAQGLPGKNLLPLGPFPPLLRAYNQALLGIQPMDTLGVQFTSRPRA
jgi:hypothetical protein